MIDYTKQPCVYEGILTPADAPEWMRDREILWDALEAIEQPHEGRVALDLTLSLPHQFDEDQMRDAVTGFLEKQFVARGLVCDYAIHAPDMVDKRYDHYHAHALVTERAADANGFCVVKERSLVEQGKFQDWRLAWETELNAIFERDQIDHRKGEVLYREHRSGGERGIETLTGDANHQAAARNVKDIHRRQDEETFMVWMQDEQWQQLAEELQQEISPQAKLQQEKVRRFFGDCTAPTRTQTEEINPTRKPKSRGWDLER